jgi:hypothetical protein
MIKACERSFRLHCGSHKQDLSGDLRKLWNHVVFCDSPRCFYHKLCYGSMSGLGCCYHVEGIVKVPGPLLLCGLKVIAALEQDEHGLFQTEAVPA